MITQCSKCKRYLIDDEWVINAKVDKEEVTHGLCPDCELEEYKRLSQYFGKRLVLDVDMPAYDVREKFALAFGKEAGYQYITPVYDENGNIETYRGLGPKKGEKNES